MFKLGLTGSIGMGKSTTAQMFVDLGCAVWDADAAVHRLYARSGKAVAQMKSEFPSSVRNSEVSRDALREIISSDQTALARIEAIVHPLVREDREEFTRAAQTDIVVYDIPLLFEGGGGTEFDAVATVFVDAKEQRHRVMERGTMTETQFEMILSKQMPAEDKVSKADYVIHTDNMDHAQQQVAGIVAEIRDKLANA